MPGALTIDARQAHDRRVQVAARRPAARTLSPGAHIRDRSSALAVQLLATVRKTGKLMASQSRRGAGNARQAAEAAFKSATTPPREPAPVSKAPIIPGATETVTLRIDREVLGSFQEGGPEWQARINGALRKAAGK
jgi:uncharacterized protein (DUF4415 family)